MSTSGLRRAQPDPAPPLKVADGPTEAGVASTRILVNAVFRAIADTGSKIATAALYIFVARKLGSTEFGVYSFALSFVGLVTIGSFGQDIVLTREVARDHSRLDEYFSDAIVARFVFSVVPVSLAAGVGLLVGLSVHACIVVLILGVGFAGDYMVQVPFAAFQAFERLSLVAVVLIVQRWATTLAAIVALYLGSGLITVVTIYTFGSLSAAALGTWLMFPRIAPVRLRFDLRGAARLTREAAPIGLSLLAFILLFRLDMTMLAFFKSSRDVGEYGAAYRLLETTGFLTWAVTSAVLPSLARLSPTSSPPVGAVFQRGLKLLVALTLPVSVGMALLSVPIISLLYGTPYHRAAGALLLLAPTIALAPISALTCQLFYAQGQRSTVAKVYAIVVVENVVWNLVAIPRYSLLGAAAGTSVSEVLVVCSLLWLSRSMYGRLDVRRMLLGPGAASAATAAVLVALHATALLALPVAAAAFLVVLLTVERLRFPEDFAVARSFALQLRRHPANNPPAAERS